MTSAIAATGLRKSYPGEENLLPAAALHHLGRADGMSR
jgi:hypothetical protein